jgi:hypothetical protein
MDVCMYRREGMRRDELIDRSFRRVACQIIVYLPLAVRKFQCPRPCTCSHIHNARACYSYRYAYVCIVVRDCIVLFRHLSLAKPLRGGNIQGMSTKNRTHARNYVCVWCVCVRVWKSYHKERSRRYTKRYSHQMTHSTVRPVRSIYCLFGLALSFLLSLVLPLPLLLVFLLVPMEKLVEPPPPKLPGAPTELLLNDDAPPPPKDPPADPPKDGGPDTEDMANDGAALARLPAPNWVIEGACCMAPKAPVG